MKQCKIIHINDGNPQELYNENRYYYECYPRMEATLESYLNEGYEVRQVMPHVTPAIQGDGIYSFYQTGYSFYLEREIEPETEEKSFEDYLNEALKKSCARRRKPRSRKDRPQTKNARAFLQSTMTRSRWPHWSMRERTAKKQTDFPWLTDSSFSRMLKAGNQTPQSGFSGLGRICKRRNRHALYRN